MKRGKQVCDSSVHVDFMGNFHHVTHVGFEHNLTNTTAQD